MSPTPHTRTVIGGLDPPTHAVTKRLGKGSHRSTSIWADDARLTPERESEWFGGSIPPMTPEGGEDSQPKRLQPYFFFPTAFFAALASARSAASFARNLVSRPISPIGTVLSSGKRSVPLLLTS